LWNVKYVLQSCESWGGRQTVRDVPNYDSTSVMLERVGLLDFKFKTGFIKLEKRPEHISPEKWTKNFEQKKEEVTMDNETKIRNILSGIYKCPSIRKKVVPLFLGNPGLNKSSAIRAFAKEKGVKLVTLVLSQRSPNEISGVLMPDKGMMRYFDYDLLKTLREGDILFLDEVLNAPSMVLNACLTILMDRELISGYKLPNIMIVAAANPQGATRLTPQQKERFIFYDIELDRIGFRDHLIRKYDMPVKIARDLVELVSTEKFIGNGFNYLSARSVDLAVGMMIEEIPTPYESKLLGVLSRHVENELGEDDILNDGSIFLDGEMMSWLKLKQKDRIDETIDK